MTAINSQDERTLTARGRIRVTRGEYRGGLADLRRAHEVNPNYAFALFSLAFAEATTGLAQEAEAHAQLALRLSPRDYWIGTAHLALAMAHFTQRNYDEAMRWCESAIQAQQSQKLELGNFASRMRGWEAGIRTPIRRSRVCSLTVRRRPSRLVF